MTVASGPWRSLADNPVQQKGVRPPSHPGAASLEVTVMLPAFNPLIKQAWHVTPWGKGGQPA